MTKTCTLIWVDKETIMEAIEKVKKYVSICQEVESLLIGGLLA